jgi:hypothetical protein
MFIIVKVDQNYDDVEGVELITQFATEKEASDYMEYRKKEYIESANAHVKYIDDFVAKFPEPKTHQEREKFTPYMTHNPNFRQALRYNLISKNFKPDNFNPPVIIDSYNLFILEVPNATQN